MCLFCCWCCSWACVRELLRMWCRKWKVSVPPQLFLSTQRRIYEHEDIIHPEPKLTFNAFHLQWLCGSFCPELIYLFTWGGCGRCTHSVLPTWFNFNDEANHRRLKQMSSKWVGVGFAYMQSSSVVTMFCVNNVVVYLIAAVVVKIVF